MRLHRYSLTDWLYIIMRSHWRFLSNKFQLVERLARSIFSGRAGVLLSVRPISNQFSEKFLPPPGRRCQSDSLLDPNHHQPSRPQPPGLTGSVHQGWYYYRTTERGSIKPTLSSRLSQLRCRTAALNSRHWLALWLSYLILKNIKFPDTLQPAVLEKCRIVIPSDHESKELIIYNISKPGAQALIVQFYNCIFLPDWRY